MCPVIETEGANFAGNTDVKVRKDEINEETDSNNGWQVVKRKQSKPKKGTKAKTGEEGMGEVNLSKFLMCKASNNKATKSMSVETLMKQLENDQRASPDFAPNVV